MVCRWLADREQGLDAEALCTMFAVMTSDTETDCLEQRDGCLAQRALKDTAEEQRQLCETQVLAKPRPDCQASVGQLERCVLESYEDRAAFARKFSCSMPKRDAQLGPPSSCGAVSRSCFPAGGIEDP